MTFYISTRISEKVADKNLSTFCETTLNHGFYGAEEEQNDAKGRKKEKGKKGLCGLLFYILATFLSRKHDLSGPVFQNPERYSHSLIQYPWYNTKSQHDQLQAGFTAQLVEHCTRIAQVKGANSL